MRARPVPGGGSDAKAMNALSAARRACAHVDGSFVIAFMAWTQGCWWVQAKDGRVGARAPGCRGDSGIGRLGYIGGWTPFSREPMGWIIGGWTGEFVSERADMAGAGYGLLHGCLKRSLGSQGLKVMGWRLIGCVCVLSPEGRTWSHPISTTLIACRLTFLQLLSRAYLLFE